MFLSMFGDVAVFWLYVTLICSFLHYIPRTLKTRCDPEWSTTVFKLHLHVLSLHRIPQTTVHISSHILTTIAIFITGVWHRQKALTHSTHDTYWCNLGHQGQDLSSQDLSSQDLSSQDLSRPRPIKPRPEPLRPRPSSIRPEKKLRYTADLTVRQDR